ncbi:MAG: hypothetical protein U0271_43705 [Polyangiaceae bacterium]
MSVTARSDLPLVRARHPQTLLRLAHKASSELHAAVEERLGRGTIAAVDAAIAGAWIPIELDVAVIEAVAAVFGERATNALVLSRQRDEMGSALFAAFVEAVLRLSGASAAFVLRRLPMAWNQLFRDVGRLELLEVRDDAARVALVDLPRVCADSAAWVAAVPHGLAIAFELVGVEGLVTYADGARGRDLTLDFRWENRRARP